MQELDVSKLKGVLFDLGNTLIYIDNDPNLRSSFVYDRLVKVFGPDDPKLTYEEHTSQAMELWLDMKKECFAKGEDFPLDEFTRGLLKKQGCTDEAVDRIAPRYNEIIYSFEYENTAVYDSAGELLEYLKSNNYRIGLVSNTSYCEERIRNMMRKVDIDKYFEIVLTSSDERIAKPNPAIFHKAMELLNLKPEEALYVGDRPEFDRDGAINAGMQWFLVDEESTLKTLLSQLQ